MESVSSPVSTFSFFAHGVVPRSHQFDLKAVLGQIRRYFILGVISLVFFLPAAALHAANPVDHSAWDAFLKKSVNEKGEVNYQAVKNDPAALDEYFKNITSIGGKVMSRWPREETLAFWLNVYHAALIKLVGENYPVSTVQKIPGFWDIAMVRLGTTEKEKKVGYSLNDIRTKCLLGVYRDEKIDLVLSLAAKGGPRLPREAFTGPKVEGQLFLLARQFVKDPGFVDVVVGRKKIRISRIFKWYAQDFRLDFGIPEPIGKFSPSETAVISCLAHYLEDEAKNEYLQDGNYMIEYPTFDWSLNDWKTQAS